MDKNKEFNNTGSYSSVLKEIVMAVVIAFFSLITMYCSKAGLYFWAFLSITFAMSSAALYAASYGLRIVLPVAASFLAGIFLTTFRFAAVTTLLVVVFTLVHVISAKMKKGSFETFLLSYLSLTAVLCLVFYYYLVYKFGTVQQGIEGISEYLKFLISSVDILPAYSEESKVIVTELLVNNINLIFYMFPSYISLVAVLMAQLSRGLITVTGNAFLQKHGYYKPVKCPGKILSAVFLVLSFVSLFIGGTGFLDYFILNAGTVLMWVFSIEGIRAFGRLIRSGVPLSRKILPVALFTAVLFFSTAYFPTLSAIYGSMTGLFRRREANPKG